MVQEDHPLHIRGVSPLRSAEDHHLLHPGGILRDLVHHRPTTILLFPAAGVHLGSSLPSLNTGASRFRELPLRLENLIVNLWMVLLLCEDIMATRTTCLVVEVKDLTTIIVAPTEVLQ